MHLADAFKVDVRSARAFPVNRTHDPLLLHVLQDPSFYENKACYSLSRMTPTNGSLLLLRISHNAKGSCGVSGSSRNSMVMV